VGLVVRRFGAAVVFGTCFAGLVTVFLIAYSENRGRQQHCLEAGGYFVGGACFRRP
jgi:hypothetical protein